MHPQQVENKKMSGSLLGKRKAEEDSPPPVAPPSQDPEERRYRGVRKRTWGVWVTEVREPASRKKVWLGSYSTAEEAARVYDMGMLLLRRVPAWRLNFPPSQQRPVIVKTVVATALLEAAQLGYAAREKEAATNPRSKVEPGQPVRMEGKFESDMVQMSIVGDSVRMVDYWPEQTEGGTAGEKATSADKAVLRGSVTPASPNSAVTSDEHDGFPAIQSAREAPGMVPLTPLSKERLVAGVTATVSSGSNSDGAAYSLPLQPSPVQPQGFFLFGSWHQVSPAVPGLSPLQDSPPMGLHTPGSALQSSASGKLRSSSPGGAFSPWVASPQSA